MKTHAISRITMAKRILICGRDANRHGSMISACMTIISLGEAHRLGCQAATIMSVSTIAAALHWIL